MPNGLETKSSKCEEIQVSQNKATADQSDATKLPSTVTVLNHISGSKVYLVGTAHFSKESQDDVVQVNFIKKPFKTLSYQTYFLTDHKNSETRYYCT